MGCLYDEFDKIGNLCYLNAWKRAKESETLELFEFNPRNKSHLYVLKVSSIMCENYGYELFVHIGWIRGLFLKYKTKIKFKIIPKTNLAWVNLSWFSCKSFCNYIEKESKINLSDIYEAYYERSKIN